MNVIELVPDDAVPEARKRGGLESSTGGRRIEMFGYAGKILFVDLSTRLIKTIPPTDKYAADFLGGAGGG
ncbi:hypothetical protein [Thermococcus peptonophilus]|uniref:hypothetical protein n=1 Tax=Thermococcus peptonophilus TaxID=53952 RepID=UPI0006D29598